MAHALTAARVLLALPFAVLMSRASARAAALAAVVLAAAIATDLLDGPVARRRRTASAAGRAFDHAADCLFVTTGLAGAAARGAVPWLLPLLVVLAFAQYVADSHWLHRERTLRMSALGRWNGILYFVPLGADVMARAALPSLAPLVTGFAWMLVATTIVSMGERLWALRPSPGRAAGSPAGERASRRPR
jgi:phosphatidylglycerophosphate synthase